MKMNALKVMMVTLLATQSFLSYAGFLNEIDGSYKAQGKKCVFKSSTKPTGRVAINSNESGATVYLEVLMGRYKTEIPVSFRSGTGDEKRTTMEGDIVRLPVTRRVKWNTDESNRVAVISEYEGVGVAKLTGTFTLSETDRDQLQIVLSTKDERVECDLIKK